MKDNLIEITEPGPGIVQVRMQDRANKNTFTDALIGELSGAFADLNRRDELKVVILTGYDNYFSSGGTQEGLRALHEGQFQFTDKDLYSLPLNCPVPVIAAMQGHSIGGGFVLGLFADMVILARESIYTANFMKYGFTPGMGATLVLPRKLGLGLAEEMMLSAESYRGEQLRQRGVPFPVVPRVEVLDLALEKARTLADKPRLSLVTLKDHLVESLRQELPRFIQREIEMQELTFHLPEVKERIERLFGF